MNSSEAGLRQEIEIHREMLDHLEDVVFCHDPDGTFIYLSPAFWKLFGDASPESSRLDFASILAPEYLSEAMRRTEMQKKGLSVPQPWELQVVTRDGEKIWVQVRTKPAYDSQGRLTKVYGVARNISDRKAMEEQLKVHAEQLEQLVELRTEKFRESEQRFREMAEMLPETVFEIDLGGRLTFVNRSAFGMFGVTVEDYERGLNAFEMLAPQERERARENLARVLAGADLGLTEYTVCHRDGTTIPVLIRSAAILRDGHPVGLRGFILNIKERKQHENALRESEERYRRILETVPDGIAIVRVEDGLFMQVNEYFSRLTGYSRDETVGHTSLELGLWVDPLERARFVEVLRERGEVNKVEIRFRSKQGGIFDALFSARRLTYGGEECLVAVVTDVTNLKKAEAELARLATVIEQATEGILITERDGSIIYANPEFLRVSGFAREEIVGRNIRTLKPDLDDDGYYRNIWATVSAGRAWKGRTVNRTKDGSLREFESAISPIRDSSGVISNFVSINRDVTQELALENQLRQAQKLEAIGTLAGGIAHDFNNILSAIIGYSELAGLDAAGDPLVQSHLQEVLKGAKRARDLVRQILTFSRQGQQERKPVYIGTIVREALKLLRATLPSTIEIRQKLEPDCGPVEADPTQIHQVLMNLCTNAAHAMRETGGALEVQLRSVPMDRIDAGQHPDLHPGAYRVLTVRDTGHGITGENLERIFNPYFTTKEKGEGTGLGLAVVQGIVKSHGGAVTVASRPGLGTTFNVFLPAIEIEPETEREGSAALNLGQGHILLVDDERDLVDIGRLTLERLGYTVTTRTSSVEALELFRADPGKFKLVITDMTMPNMTGDLLARRMLEIRPDIPIVLCTGYSERMSEARAHELGITAFAMKPIVIQELSKTIRKALGAE